MTPPPQDYLHGVPTAVIGGSLNLLAYFVSMQDIEVWLRVSSLIAGNLVGILTIWNLALAIKKKVVDTKEP
jgi:hypothetical protein